MSMGVVATVAAVGSAAATMYSANKASSSANKAIDAQRESTERQDQLSREAFDWYKQEYARTAPARDRAEATAQDTAETQLSLMRDAQTQFKDQAEYAKTFRPVEQRIVRDALGYNTEARREAEAGRAMADIQQQADVQRGVTQRNMQRMGVNPNDGRMAAVAGQIEARTALGQAAAAGGARRMVEQIGDARMKDAAGIGRGVIGNQATFLNAANASGNSATGNSISGINAAMSGAPLMTQGFNTAIGGAQRSAGNYAGMADMFNNRAGQAIQGFGNFMQGMGQLGWKPFATQPGAPG